MKYINILTIFKQKYCRKGWLWTTLELLYLILRKRVRAELLLLLFLSCFFYFIFFCPFFIFLFLRADWQFSDDYDSRYKKWERKKERKEGGERRGSHGIFSAVCSTWVRSLGQHQPCCQRKKHMKIKESEGDTRGGGEGWWETGKESWREGG